ncbi:hypothetical protein BDZ89DRAFT_1061662 [Hymenopellis radicata]|nr:hypothetical protein BDZ89DRAFT_1061662 [Hymenopellis radicata]
MQLFDDARYASIFLWRLVLRDGDFASSTDTAQSTSTVSFADRLKSLFWIAVTNFVVPVLLSLAQ